MVRLRRVLAAVGLLLALAVTLAAAGVVLVDMVAQWSLTR